jgi:hypothetical protein
MPAYPPTHWTQFQPFPSSGAPPAGGAEEALASIAHEMIEAQLFRQMAVDSSSPNPWAGLDGVIAVSSSGWT